MVAKVSKNSSSNKIAKMLRTPRFRQLVIKNKKRYNRKTENVKKYFSN
tara:strand:+ start:286 stop:429 length:144 start_codon:yes stop_codon:yes gene_type:complete